MGQLDGKVALITGATSGSGRGIARLFAAEGADVVLLARGQAKLEETAAGIGSRAMPVSADLGDPASIRKAFERVRERFGKLDILANNAGAGRPSPVESLKDEDIALQVGTNLLGVVHTCREAIPLLRAAGGGDIVNTSSESTLDPFPHLSMYVATKAAVEAFGKVLRAEVKQDGIRVTTFIQGRTGESSFGAAWDPQTALDTRAMWEREGFMARVAGNTVQDPAWIAQVMLFVVTRPRAQMLDTIHVRSFS